MDLTLRVGDVEVAGGGGGSSVGSAAPISDLQRATGSGQSGSAGVSVRTCKLLLIGERLELDYTDLRGGGGKCVRIQSIDGKVYAVGAKLGTTLLTVIRGNLTETMHISVVPASLSVMVGEEKTIAHHTEPFHASATGNANIVTIGGGSSRIHVTGRSGGTTNVTITQGGHSRTCTVTVNIPEMYTRGQTIRSASPVYANCVVTQGFNDSTVINPNAANYKGHFGYDIGGFQNNEIKPIFPGRVVALRRDNSNANGRIVVLRHDVGGVIFHSSYSHLATVSSNLVADSNTGTLVTRDTVLGIMGGSGSGSDSAFAPHLHLAVYTRGPSSNPYGYAGSTRQTTFQQAAGTHYNPWYYGPDESKFPRCGGLCFYDPFHVISTNAGIITVHHP